MLIIYNLKYLFWLILDSMYCLEMKWSEKGLAIR